MKLSNAMLLVGLLLLTACSSSHRVTYSGHEESTDGVPGFKNGKKVSPNVKLGQSYSIDGETYTPRHEPDYVEEGLASWYGPGFHGGKTANGEEFDKHDMTAAHRTLPLPSIVRVTLLSTGKQVFVRVNDRGPFSKGRIIDLSRGAAEQIGLLGKGVDRVRVEYMPAESQLFADMLEQGRDPKSIDIASEIVGQAPTQYAANPAISQKSAKPSKRSMASRLNPISSARAAEPEVSPNDVQDVEEDSLPVAHNVPAPVPEIMADDLAAPEIAATPAKPVQMASLAAPTPAKVRVVPKPAKANVSAQAAPVATSASGQFIQLGAFQQEANAERLRKKYKSAGNLILFEKPASDGGTLYHVRMGPFATAEQTEDAIDRLAQLGVDAKIVRE